MKDLRSFAMNQKSPTRGSLEGRTGSISTLVYSFEARLNLPNWGHVLVRLPRPNRKGAATQSPIWA